MVLCTISTTGARSSYRRSSNDVTNFDPLLIVLKIRCSNNVLVVVSNQMFYTFYGLSFLFALYLYLPILCFNKHMK